MEKNFRVEVVNVYGDNEFCFYGQNVTIEVNVYVNNVLVFKEMPLNTVFGGVDESDFDIEDYITDYEDLKDFVGDREEDYLWDGRDEYDQVTFRGSDKIFSYEDLKEAFFDESFQEDYLKDYYNLMVYEDDFFEGIDSLEEFIEFITDEGNLECVGSRGAMCENYQDYMVDIKTIDIEVVEQLFGEDRISVGLYVGDVFGDGFGNIDYEVYDSLDYIECEIIDIYERDNTKFKYNNFIGKTIKVHKGILLELDTANDYSIEFGMTVYIKDILLNNNISRFTGSDIDYSEEDQDIA